MKNIRFILYVSMLLIFPFVGKSETDPDWSCDIHAYQYDMSVYLSLQKDGESVLGDYLVAAFCGEECRGIAELQTVKEATFYYIRIRSQKSSGESISFKVYDRSVGKEQKASGTLSFASLEQVGYPSQPWILTLPTVVDPENGLDDIDETTQEIVLTGTWTQEKIDQLIERIHKEGDGGNSELSTVDMGEVIFDDNVSLDGLFSNCENLTSVILPDLSAVEQVPDNTFEGVNPNCLVFVTDDQKVPDTWREQVNVVVDGEIEQLVLVEDKPFHSPLPFYAEQAVYRRTFTNNRPEENPTEAGWETICLPFDVNIVMYGKNELVPVLAAGEVSDGDFHIATLTDRGFELFSGKDGICMEANTPYVLNMISPDGIAIEGEVSFIAKGGVQIAATQPCYIKGNSQQSLVGVYRLTNSGKNDYVMNEKGDAFVKSDMSVPPFEAFLRSQTGSSSSVPVVLFIPVSGVQLPFKVMSIEVGETVTFTVMVTPENATNPNVIWSSSDERVATVSSSGLVTGVKAGTTTITVRTEDGDFTATCVVTVTKDNGSNPDSPDDPDNSDDPDPDVPDNPDDPTDNESVKTMSIQVYPTQVVDYVHVGVLPAKSHLILFNIAGKPVRQMLSCEGNVDLFMGDQPAGFYLLYIITGEKEKQVVKLIKRNR